MNWFKNWWRCVVQERHAECPPSYCETRRWIDKQNARTPEEIAADKEQARRIHEFWESQRPLRIEVIVRRGGEDYFDPYIP